MARLPRTAVGFIEQQSTRVLDTALTRVNRLVDQATATVNDRNRRKYVLAGLAALVAAGRVAEQAYSRLRSTPPKAASKKSRRKKPARAKVSRKKRR